MTVVTYFPIKAAAFSALFLGGSVITTWAPSSTKRLAVAKPIPLLPACDYCNFPFKLSHNDSLRIRYTGVDSLAVDENCSEVLIFCLFVQKMEATLDPITDTSERCT